MKKKPYSELDTLIAVANLLDDEEDALTGFGINHVDLAAFIADVERLAMEKYGGSAFSELLDNDSNDLAGIAARRHHSQQKKSDETLRAANVTVRNVGTPDERRITSI